MRASLIQLAPNYMRHRCHMALPCQRTSRLLIILDRLFISIDHHRIPISASLFPCGQSSGVGSVEQYRVAATIKDDKGFVAVYENNYRPLSLYCVERRSGKVIWRSIVWAAYVDFIPGGSGFWYSDWPAVGL